MIKINIDGNDYEVKEGKNLLETCLSLGMDLPYFCWHPAMGSVGACRQCAVSKYKDENDQHGKLIMACMEPLQNGMRISLNDPESVKFRASVIEWLMTNHPHDCPICDEGGECHLQDMTVMTGHNYRRFRFKKRTYNNQYLGPFINHEMNRCIQCYRCVRFYRDYAGGKDFNAFSIHNNVYFGRYKDGVLENEFSGNLIEVCPTGVFTDRTLKKHYTRKWDLTNAPSICHNCGLGCNIIAAERYGGLRRILSRYNGEVNGYFICDRGRFGYEYVNSADRIKTPLIKNTSNGKHEITNKNKFLEYFKNNFSASNKIIGIGSPRASLESNFALMTLVGENNFYSGINGKEHKLASEIQKILLNGTVKTPSLKEIENADGVLILGEDLTNTAPMLALAVRQAIHQQPKQILNSMNIPDWNDAASREAIQELKGPLFIVSPSQTKLDDAATAVFRTSPQNISRIGFAIASMINKKAPRVEGLSKSEKDFAFRAANALALTKKPVVISGTSLFDITVIHSAANVAWALHSNEKQAKLCYTVPEVNSIGSSILTNQSLQDALIETEKGNVDAAVILENDLYRRDTKETIDRFFQKCKIVIVLDYLHNETTGNASAVIPAGTFAETDGTLVNNEGRAQRFYQVYKPAGEINESWKWLQILKDNLEENNTSQWKNFDDLINALVEKFPMLERIQNLAPPSDYRIAGQKIPREPHRYSGRTAMHADKNVSEPMPPEDPDSALSFTMEGFHGKPPSSVIPFFWSPGWNSAQSINKYQIEVGGHLHDGDPGKRLFEPNNDKAEYFTDVPDAEKISHSTKDFEWLLFPVYNIYGSEELSSKSEAVMERITEPHLILNPDDAKKLNVENNEKINISMNQINLSLPVLVNSEIPGGIAGYPFGLKNIPVINFPAKCKLEKVSK